MELQAQCSISPQPILTADAEALGSVPSGAQPSAPSIPPEKGGFSTSSTSANFLRDPAAPKEPVGLWAETVALSLL